MRRLLVGAALLLVAGCGGDPTPSPSPSAPSSPVSSSPVSTTPSAPVMPEAAKANTKAGAVAFVKYYVKLINYAQATGDVDALAMVDAEDCASCANARRALSEIYQGGGHIEGGALHASVMSTARRPEVNGWTVFLGVSYGPQSIVRPQGTETLSGGKNLMTIVVRQVKGAWTVVQWSRSS